MKKTILGLLCIVALGAATLSTNGYQVGDTAEDFSLMGVDDQEHSMSDYEDAKGFVVIFTCNHCPYSVAYEDRIIALHAKFGDDYPVIAINPNDPVSYPSDNFENMKARAEEKGFKFDYLFDDGQQVFPKFGATKTPHVFLLDKDLKVQYIGAIDNSTEESDVSKTYLADAIESLREGETLEVTSTKAIGCGIKVAKH